MEDNNNYYMYVCTVAMYVINFGDSICWNMHTYYKCTIYTVRSYLVPIKANNIRTTCIGPKADKSILETTYVHK